MHEAERDERQARLAAAYIDKLLHAPDYFSRMGAADRLAGLVTTDGWSRPPFEAYEPLLTALADQDGAVRAAAARAIGRYRVAGFTPTIVARLSELLHDEDWSVQAGATDGLGSTASPDAVAPLAAALRQPDAPHYDIAGALSQLGALAEPTLHELAADPDPTVAHWARRALDG